jgi:hypothetical protein
MTMTEHNIKNEQVEYELMEIASVLTAMGDMIQGLFNYEEIESETPKGIKILIADIRKRIDNLRKYISKKEN